MTIESDRSKDESERLLRSQSKILGDDSAPPVLFTLRSLRGDARLQAGSQAGSHEELLAPKGTAANPNEAPNLNRFTGFSEQDGRERPSSLSEASSLQHQADLGNYPSSSSAISSEAITTESEPTGSDSQQVASAVIHRKPALLSRSWGERIGSHGIVISLLLAVVAAALFTGKQGVRVNPDPNDLLSFDDESVDVALPDMLAIDLGQLENQAIDEEESYTLSESSTEGSQSMLLSESSLSQPLGNPTPAEFGHHAEQATASMEVSVPSTSGELFQNRSEPAKETQSSLSGLSASDQQVSRQEKDGLGEIVPRTIVNVPKQTATPAEISDWLKFLPSVDRIASEPTSPSSSIQK